MKVGFVGLGNVGGKLAKSLLRNNFDLMVRDLDQNLTENFRMLGAKVANSPKDVITMSCGQFHTILGLSSGAAAGGSGRPGEG